MDEEDEVVTRDRRVQWHSFLSIAQGVGGIAGGSFRGCWGPAGKALGSSGYLVPKGGCGQVVEGYCETALRTSPRKVRGTSGSPSLKIHPPQHICEGDGQLELSETNRDD